MENQEFVTHAEESLKINSTTEKYLTEIRKWAHFLSIVGFILVGLMAVGSFAIGAIFSALPMDNNVFPFPSSLFSGIYLLLALVYFFPVYYLYQFSVKMKNALLQKTDDVLETSFRFLKSHYKFMGIFTIIMLALYPIMIVGVILFGVMNNM